MDDLEHVVRRFGRSLYFLILGGTWPAEWQENAVTNFLEDYLCYGKDNRRNSSHSKIPDGGEIVTLWCRSLDFLNKIIAVVDKGKHRT